MKETASEPNFERWVWWKHKNQSRKGVLVGRNFTQKGVEARGMRLREKEEELLSARVILSIDQTSESPRMLYSIWCLASSAKILV